MVPKLRNHFVEAEVVNDVPVIRLTARSLDDITTAGFGDQVFSLVNQLGEGRVVHLDLGNVRSLNTTGIAKILGLFRHVRARGGRLTLVNVQPFVYEVLEVTRLHTLLDVRRKEAG